MRVLHAADFHLDSAFGALTAEQARQRRAESRRSPERLVEWANDHGVQLLLLAGDLFDGGELRGDTAPLLARALGAFRGRVVIAPGNHDPYTADGPYARTLWPDNVHVFTEDRMQAVTFPELGCTVYGAAFTAPEIPEDHVLAGFTAPEDGLVHIGLLHGDVTGGDSRYRPLTTASIAASGLDYLALGHVHSCTGVVRAGRVAYGYCGCPEGRGFDELGDKGFLYGDIGPGTAELRFVAFARRRYRGRQTSPMAIRWPPWSGCCPRTRRRIYVGCGWWEHRRSRCGCRCCSSRWRGGFSPCSCGMRPPCAGRYGTSAARTR